MSEFSEFARKFSDLYSEEVDEKECSPVYSELKDLKTRYKGSEEVARGGTKSIKKVFDISTNRWLAMAELLPDIDESFNEVFLRESRLTALLEHPNIISVHDIGLKEDGRPYFTMDLKSGDNLEEILRQLDAGNQQYEDRYQLETLLSIFIKICDACAYAHSRNIIHLDLKPANIQVGGFGEVLVCDWGLGKILGNYDTEDLEELLLDKDLLNHMTFNGEIKGTPGYMAPEQINKDGDKNIATDIYSLGAILYSILTFKRPLDGDLESIMENTLAGKIKPPSEFRSVPESLSAVVSRAMELNPESRYNSVSQLRNEVLKFQTGYSTSAENAGFAKELSLFIKRNRTACLVGGTAILVLFLVCLLFIQNLQVKAAELRARSLELKDKKDALEEKNDEALSAKRIAEEHRKRADFVADQFELEKIESGKLIDDLSRQYQQEANSMVSRFIYTEPVASVEKSVRALRKVIDLDPENNEPYDKLVYSLFIMHDFEEILKYRDKFKTGHRNEDIFTACEKYKDRQSRKKLLKVEDFREMLADLSVSGISTGIKRTHLSEKMLAYYLQKKGGQTNTIEGIKGVLKTWNPDWDFSGFDYNPDTKELYVSSKYLKVFTYVPSAASGKCILRYLDIKNLILNNSGIYDLKQINDLKISVLDIRGTKINSLSALKKMGMLKSLIITKNQFPSEELESLPTHLKVYIKKR